MYNGNTKMCVILKFKIEPSLSLCSVQLLFKQNIFLATWCEIDWSLYQITNDQSNVFIQIDGNSFVS